MYLMQVYFKPIVSTDAFSKDEYATYKTSKSTSAPTKVLARQIKVPKQVQG